MDSFKNTVRRQHKGEIILIASAKKCANAYQLAPSFGCREQWRD